MADAMGVRLDRMTFDVTFTAIKPRSALAQTPEDFLTREHFWSRFIPADARVVGFGELHNRVDRATWTNFRYEPRIIQTRAWDDKMYFMPIHRDEINRNDGGRGVYWEEPGGGHFLEIITRPYGSGG